MFRSMKIFNRFHSLAVLAFVLSAVAFLFASCNPAPVPVTGKEKPVVAAAAADKPAGAVQAQRNLDLGAGYRLETSAQGVRIVAPETIVRPADKSYDLGAGYRLVVTSSGGEIIPPARPSTTLSRVDIGAGYILEINGENGHIIPPASPIQAKAQNAPQSNASQQKEYIGGGFWLITGPDGGKIVQEGTK